MVLYLRTFADDSLTIRTATYARRSFIDRLSPRRFERFEEVLIRNLTMIGPVVALNPPGTNLAPIGASRETLDADHWQSTITGWMTDARLIVVGAAPEAMTPGFGWELRMVDSQRLWPKHCFFSRRCPTSQCAHDGNGSPRCSQKQPRPATPSPQIRHARWRCSAPRLQDGPPLQPSSGPSGPTLMHW
jgi:hypothetical protein